VKLEGEVWFSGLAFLLSPLVKVLLDRQSERNFDTLKRRLDELGSRIQVGGS
jgi:hypothetical protein